MNRRLHDAKKLIMRHQYATAILIVIVITCGMTAVSMFLYIQSGASGLDLSRPGFTATRDDRQTERAPTFSPTGPLTESDINEFQALYEEQRVYLQSLGRFDGDVLSDEVLGFTLEDASSEELE